MHSLHFSGDSPVAQMVKNANAGDLGLIPESGRFPEKGNGNPLQYSCLRNPMDRGASGLQSVGVTKELDSTTKLHFRYHVVIHK